MGCNPTPPVTFPNENDESLTFRTDSAQILAESESRKMKFPKVIRHRKAEVTIYGKRKAYPFYRLAYRVNGQRRMNSFTTFAEAKAEADKKVRELSQGSQRLALTTKEVTTALTIREALESHRRETGRNISALQAVTGYLDVTKLLPADHNLADAVRGYLGNVAVVQRKPLAEAVAEFCEARKVKAVALPGKRPALNPIYVANTARQLNEFARTFSGTAVSDLVKAQLDAFVNAHPKLSPKSRNHLRTTLRMFLRWCVRRDYLPANHRLLQADGLQNEPLDDAPIDFYRPKELRVLLEKSSGKMRAIIALQALAGLRLQEALRLDWREVFGIAGHIEVSTSKSKTRQRRLVEIRPALEQWLAPYRGLDGKVATQTLNGYTASFITLRKSLKIPPRRNGLRHGFVTFHFALHANENQTAALAGNSPAMIHAHYKGLATRAEAEKWFNVRPAKAANVIPPRKGATA
jgi:integrase